VAGRGILTLTSNIVLAAIQEASLRAQIAAANRLIEANSISTCRPFSEPKAERDLQAGDLRRVVLDTNDEGRLLRDGRPFLRRKVNLESGCVTFY
jgi:hypothetical protein